MCCLIISPFLWFFAVFDLLENVDFSTLTSFRRSIQTLRYVRIRNVGRSKNVGVKNNLDKFWSNQEVHYNFKSEITGTGNRSACQNWLESCCTEAFHKDEGLEASQPASSTSIRYDPPAPKCKSWMRLYMAETSHSCVISCDNIAQVYVVLLRYWFGDRKDIQTLAWN